jgi:hypothetical protein
MKSSTKPSIKQSFREYLERRRPEAVTGDVWHELLRTLAPVSESYLRELVRATGLPFAQPYAGIRQHGFEELEASLREMLAVYQEAVADGDRQRARYCRKQVIAAKDKAGFAARNPRTPAEKQAVKLEMIEWMMVWLENPPVFPEWVELRKRAKTG